MTALAGATLTRARARRANPKYAVVHLVPVLHSDTSPTQPALCLATSAGPWVLHPTWPDRPCPLCHERADLPVGAP